MLSLSIYWFAINFHWGALLSVIIPVQVLLYVADAQKAGHLATVLAWGAVVALVVQPLGGALSDRLRPRFGRRPFLVVGTIGNAAALMWLAYTPTYTGMFVGVLLVQLFNNIAAAGYQGYIPDLVQEERRGQASGYMGGMTMLGTIVGVGLAGVFVHPPVQVGHYLQPGLVTGFYWVVALVLVVCMLATLWRVPENRTGEAPPWHDFWQSLWVDPRQHADFWWLFLTRALVMLAFYLLLFILQYFIKDVLQVADYTGATAIVSAAVLVGATISAYFGGLLSDRLGRRGVVAVAGGLMAVASLAFAFLQTWDAILAAGIVFGLGYGAFTSVDWALGIDVLPSQGSAAKDLGIWTIASIIPQVFASKVGAWALALGALLVAGGGYPALFIVAFVAAGLGSVMIWRVRTAQ